jgi:hemoglobin-like flavoprotein
LKLDKAILYLLNFRRDDSDEPNTLSAIRQKHAAFNLTLEDISDFEQGLLRAIAKAGEDSDEACEAWKVTIQSGLEYMKGCTVKELA